MRWVTQASNVMVLDILNSEFQWVSRQNDVLIKVYSPEVGEFLILNELQLRYSSKMPLRMRAYTALAEEKYKLPILPVLINVLPPGPLVTINDRYESNYFGLQARQDYKVINLWEVDVQTVFEQNISALLPLVPVLDGGDDIATVERALHLLQMDDDLSEMEPLLGFFASFVLDAGLINQILRWDMAILRESPWLNQMLLESEAMGEAKGKATGKATGKLEEGQSLVLRQLVRRVGVVGAELEARVRALALADVEALGEALLDFSGREDLMDWLSMHEG